MAMRWYVVHAFTGFENVVKRDLEERVVRLGQQEHFGRILVPSDQVEENRGGRKVVSDRKFFPGYVLVEMEMSDESWHLVKSTTRVTGFIGGSGMRPTSISQKEVDSILQQMQDGAEKPKPKIQFEVGQSVRVTEGAFTDFNGIVEEVNYEKNRLRVGVEIFGRSTPVDVGFGQVEKV